MEIYGIFKIEDVEKIALKFSEDNNIVSALNKNGLRKNKKVWANLMNENGLGGGDNSANIDYYSEQRNKNVDLSIIRRYGVFKDFIVRCYKCNIITIVNERDKAFPKKKKYFCSRSCANSKTFSQETRDKISAKAKKQKNRSKFPTSKGTKYMNFDSKVKRVKNKDIPYFLEQVWNYGMGK